MSVPSVKNALAYAAALKHKSLTIACVTCKKPLWEITITGRYGSRIASIKEPYPGVPPYEDYWAKDQKTLLREDCPHCGKDFMRAIVAEGQAFARPYVVQFDGAGC